jgi:hypothetical protein
VIYFVQAGRYGNIKIGHTNGEVEVRMASLQTGCPEILRLLATIDGDVALESAIHKELAPFRLHGEWFKPCYAVRALMERFIQEQFGGVFLGWEADYDLDGNLKRLSCSTI